MSIYRDFTMPGEYVNLQRLCSDFIWCPEYVYLQRFYGASRMSIYRDFA